MSELKPQLRKRFDAFVNLVECTAGMPLGHDLTQGFPEAKKLAVCTGVAGETPANIDVFSESTWALGEVLFLDEHDRCIVSGRAPNGRASFEYFEVTELAKAVECSKNVVLAHSSTSSEGPGSTQIAQAAY